MILDNQQAAFLRQLAGSNGPLYRSFIRCPDSQAGMALLLEKYGIVEIDAQINGESEALLVRPSLKGAFMIGRLDQGLDFSGLDE